LLIVEKEDSKVKNNGKSLTMDNQYFKEMFIEIIQQEHDKDIISSLIKLLKVDPHFRTITIRLILETIQNLATGRLDSQDIEQLNQVFKNYVRNIKRSLSLSKNSKEYGFEIFEEEWKSYCKKNIGIVINDVISRPYLLIPFNLEDIVEDYPQVLKTQQTNEVNNFRGNLLIFMSFYDFRSRIFGKHEMIGERFPLSLDEENKVKKYEKESAFRCKIATGNAKNKTTHYNIFVDKENIVLCSNDNNNKSESLSVKHKYALRFLEARIEKNDTKLLNLRVKENNNDYSYLFCFFDDNKTCLVVWELIDNSRASIKEKELNILSLYFEEILNKYTRLFR